MLFSKTFGYAVRGILYIAARPPGGKMVQLDEIAKELEVPRYFMGKILQRCAKKNLLVSLKGPHGGFLAEPHILSVPLIDIFHLTDGLEVFHSCVLRMKACNEANPCAMHSRIGSMKSNLLQLLQETTLGDLVENNEKIPGLARNLPGE